MNIDSLIKIIKDTVENHKLENDGEYARFLWQNPENTRKMGLNEYGCADAVNILYTINDFIKDPASRANHIRVLQDFQQKNTGLFKENTHHFIHTTAHCVAALELLDAVPRYPLYALEEYFTPEGVRRLLDGLNWEDPWSQAHQGAGIYAAAVLTGSVDKEWERAYFNWLWENSDEKTGFCKKNGTGDSAQQYRHMAGSFHYFFNYEYAKMPQRYPEKMIDALLEMYKNDAFNTPGNVSNFGRNVGFLELDWTYSVNRALRQTAGYRRDDCIKALRKFAKDYIEWLYSLDHKTHERFNDLHMLFGATCALAELQTALLGEIETKKPLRLVLDRRPFV
ncbi:MAG: hypothetical protein E7410_06470 [Ruminococcaceae bacterium]|nr:hypothetical protein [Oscillospiraceae bacterium]